MIKGHCITNIDNVNCTVYGFARVPNIGERVFIKYKGNSSSMKVVQITHDFRNDEPYIIVELWEQGFITKD